MGKAVMRFIFSEYFVIAFITAIFSFAILVGWGVIYQNSLWPDRIAHFAGGFWAAVFFLTLSRRPEFQNFSGYLENPVHLILLAIAFTLLVGISWEIFEYSFDVILSAADTIEDLILDSAGGGLATILYFFHRSR